MTGRLNRAELMAALDLIEEHDARNLTWGLVDESWTKPQVVALLEASWTGADAEACFHQLVEDALLVKLPREWPNRYRSRMAESVRLFSNLRQVFPKKPWESSSRLVSDFRFLRRARQFPRRDIAVDRVVSMLSEREVPLAISNEVSRILSGRQISQFQFDATAAIFEALRSESDRAVVVGAGTGSGKTLSFYLPALARLAADNASGPRVIAIYPRNELLKDQLITAVAEVRSLAEKGGRQLTVGAYFGMTPYDSRQPPSERSGWRRRGSKWICPYLRCSATNANGECGGDLAWSQPNSIAGASTWGVLICQRCSAKVSDKEFLLTRQAIQAEPPDILFTTTEMLNLGLSDGWARHIFGVGPRATRKPNLVLLDEIHTYTGSSGAQVAYLLRRWRKLLGRPVTWVGLSATLANASEFLADLAGVPVEAVSDIRPDPSDLMQHGAEYQLLLRGDPASQSALLSTTIQSLMLMRRVLDERGSSLEAPFGTRVFAFLENLDLVNRLYRQLLDAEGRNPIGHPEPGKVVLAGLRLRDYAEKYIKIDDEVAWDRAGQQWWLPERLGFGSRSLTISRTSSQDSGVDSGADVVVATASLEVGYDDPRVGAVVQHKAPRDVAQFLQRRGRAGRLQSQRPWTVVVLSDYGRDRLSYQSYETLFDPSLPAKTLPLGNQSVRKMQAAMCLLDWVAVRLKVDQGSRWSVRKIWTSPASGADSQVKQCLDLLQEVMEGGSARADLIRFIETSMGLSTEEAQSVCWEHPRSLILEVVPTAYRRLLSNWSTLKHGVVRPSTDNVRRHPLPEFIPPNLFSDLELPEVAIQPPEGYDPAADTSIAIAMALNELAPGKVTLRWAVQKVRGLWIQPPEGDVLALDGELVGEGDVVVEAVAQGEVLPVVRPSVIKPSIPPPEVLATSNGRLAWRFDADLQQVGTELPMTRNGPLGSLIKSLNAYLNAESGPLQVWRYATEATADIARLGGRERRTFTFSWQGEPAAVGFASYVDAIVLTVNLPDSVAVFELEADSERLRQLRTDRFLEFASAALKELGLDNFAATWVTEVAFCVVTQTLVGGGSLTDLTALATSDWCAKADLVIDGILLASDQAEDDETPLRDAVMDALARPDVTAALVSNLAVLRESPSEDWLQWIRRRVLQTIAAAWQSAAQSLCSDFNVDSDIHVDVLDRGQEAHIVVSDTGPGGGGLVETLTRRLADDPRRFDRLVSSALEPTDVEEVDAALRLTLTLLQSNPHVAESARIFRAVQSDRLLAWQRLVRDLSELGVPRHHASMNALSTRIFRVGSTEASDALARILLDKWDVLDGVVGYAVDHRTACALLAQDPEVARRTAVVAGTTPDSVTQRWVQTVLLGLIWTRASARRSVALRTGNHFDSAAPLTERTLVKALLPNRAVQVSVDDQGWRAKLAEALRTQGLASLISYESSPALLAQAMRELLVLPLDLDWLHVHPHIEGVYTEASRLRIDVSLQEAPQ